MSNFARLAVSMSGSLHDIGLPSIVTHSVLKFFRMCFQKWNLDEFYGFLAETMTSTHKFCDWLI